MLVKYLRNRKGQRYGMVTAQVMDDNKVYLGWAVTNTKKGDQYDPEYGMIKATHRIYPADEVLTGGVEVPCKALYDVVNMFFRAQAYFHQAVNTDLTEVNSFVKVYDANAETKSRLIPSIEVLQKS